MNVRKSVLYLSCALGMLVYAVPRLDIGQGLTPPTLFGIAWISMALLIIASHLRVILRVDDSHPAPVQRHQ